MQSVEKFAQRGKIIRIEGFRVFHFMSKVKLKIDIDILINFILVVKLRKQGLLVVMIHSLVSIHGKLLL